MVGGTWRVTDGAIVGIDTAELSARHAAATRRFS